MTYHRIVPAEPAFDANGTLLWQLPGLKSYSASPILADGRLYVGQTSGTVLAIGGCP